MTLPFIVLLFILAGLFLLARYRKTGTAIMAISLLLFLLIGWGIVPTELLWDLQKPYAKIKQITWGKQNAIVVLGAGIIKITESHEILPSIIAYSRLDESIRLYHSCKQKHPTCLILISGGDTLHIGHSEAEVYRDELISIGIPHQDIRLEPNSMNTYANAEFSSQILKASQFDRIILVTSGIHIDRALRYFAHFGIHATPAPADYLTAVHSILPLGYNFTVTDFALHEYLGTLRFYLYNLFGWNHS